VLAGLVTLLETAEAILAWSPAQILQDAAAAGVAAWDAPLTPYDAAVFHCLLFSSPAGWSPPHGSPRPAATRGY
jgi:hypothetical protein